MADSDVADMKGTENQDLPEGEKSLAEAKGETENQPIEEPVSETPAKAGTEEE